MITSELAELLEKKGTITLGDKSIQLYVLTDETTAHEIRRLTGVGNIAPARKQYKYTVSRVPDVLDIMTTTMPYFKSAKWADELEQVQARFERLVGSRRTRNTSFGIAPTLSYTAEEHEKARTVLWKVWRGSQGREAGMIKSKRVYAKIGSRKRALLLQKVFGGDLKEVFPRDPEEASYFSWRVHRKEEMNRIRLELGLPELVRVGV